MVTHDGLQLKYPSLCHQQVVMTESLCCLLTTVQIYKLKSCQHTYSDHVVTKLRCLLPKKGVYNGLSISNFKSQWVSL